MYSNTSNIFCMYPAQPSRSQKRSTCAGAKATPSLNIRLFDSGGFHHTSLPKQIRVLWVASLCCTDPDLSFMKQTQWSSRPLCTKSCDHDIHLLRWCISFVVKKRENFQEWYMLCNLPPAAKEPVGCGARAVMKPFFQINTHDSYRWIASGHLNGLKW